MKPVHKDTKASSKAPGTNRPLWPDVTEKVTPTNQSDTVTDNNIHCYILLDDKLVELQISLGLINKPNG